MALLSLPSFFRRQAAEQQPRWLITLCLCGVLIYVASKIGFPYVARIALNFTCLLGFWCLYKYGRKVKSYLLFRFVWVSILIQSVSWGLACITTPDWATDSLRVEYLTRFMLFIPLAWWIAQYRNAIWWWYGIATLSIFMSPWTTGDGLQEIINGLNGKRIDLGLHNAQHTSLLFGVVFLGLLSFSKSLYIKNKIFIVPVIFFILYSLLIVFLSGSRQSWLALLVTGFLSISYFTIKKLNRSSEKNKVITVITFFVIIFSIGIMLVSNDKIVKRVMLEKEFISAITSLNFDAVPYSSFGIRLHSWEAATAFIIEKPIFGWGSNGKTLVMKKTKWLPEDIKKNFGHLHNTYIEILVNFGVVGLMFYFYMWFYFSKQVYKKIKSGELEKEIGYLYFSFLCFWSVMNLFEAYQSYWTGNYILPILLAGVLGRIWYVKLQQV